MATEKDVKIVVTDSLSPALADAARSLAKHLPPDTEADEAAADFTARRCDRNMNAGEA